MSAVTDGASVASLVVALPATVAFWLQPAPDRHEPPNGAAVVPNFGLLVSALLAYGSALLLIVVQAVAPIHNGWRWVLELTLSLFATASVFTTLVLIRKWRKGFQRLREAQSQSGA